MARKRKSTRGWGPTLVASLMSAWMLAATPARAAAAAGDVNIAPATRLVGAILGIVILFFVLLVLREFWPDVKTRKARPALVGIGIIVLLLGVSFDLYARRENSATVKTGTALVTWVGDLAQGVFRGGGSTPVVPSGTPTP